MKKLILLLVLVATANAQTSGPFPFGQFGGSNSSGPTLPVLFYMDGATGTNGAQVTTSNLNAYGSSYCNTGLTVTTANSQLVLSNAISQAVPPMAYSVGGVTIPKNNSAYFFEYNPTDTTSYYVGCNFSSPSNSAVSYGSYYYTTMNGSVDPSGLSIVEGTTTSGGDYAVTHWNGNACGSLTTNAAIHITASDSGAICFSPSHLYYLAGLQNNGGSSYNGGGYHYLMMLDPSNSYQIVGVTRVVNGFSAARNPILYVLGRDGADGSAGTGQTYFGYPVICSPTTYPCVPATPTANAPTQTNGTGSYVNQVSVVVTDLVPTVALNTLSNGINYCTDSAGTCVPGSSGTTFGTLTTTYAGQYPTASTSLTYASYGSTPTHLRMQAVSTGWNPSTVTDATYTLSAGVGLDNTTSNLVNSATSVCTALPVGPGVSNGAILAGLSFGVVPTGIACWVGTTSCSASTGGTSMSSISGTANATNYGISMFDLATGSTYSGSSPNVYCSWTGSGRAYLGATSWAGVNQTTPVAHGATYACTNCASATLGVTVTSASTDAVLAVGVSGASNVPSGALGSGNTQIWGPSASVSGGGLTAVGASSVVMSWAAGGSYSAYISGVDIQHQ